MTTRKTRATFTIKFEADIRESRGEDLSDDAKILVCGIEGYLRDQALRNPEILESECSFHETFTNLHD